jgi:hypothetical protein
MIVSFPVPELHLLDEDVCVSLDSNVRVLTTTVEQCDRLIKAFHDARELLILQARARADRADRMAARSVNLAFAVVNATPPGSVSTATTVQHIEVTGPCLCECSAVCTACRSGDGAA